MMGELMVEGRYSDVLIIIIIIIISLRKIWVSWRLYAWSLVLTVCLKVVNNLFTQLVSNLRLVMY
jgi:hypothetical protein